MVKLIGEHVVHKIFGRGEITEFIDDSVTVHFEKEDQVKKFVYPTAFGTFLVLDKRRFDDEIQKDQDVIDERESEHQKKEEARIGNGIAMRFKEYALLHAKTKGTKKAAKSNIAFKCTYCDGGKSEEITGFKGACSDEMIKHNIQVAKHAWCKNPETQCFQYLSGTIEREALDAAYEASKAEGVPSICSESQMLESWTIGAGITQSGKDKGKPMTLKRTGINSLALLTSRFPKEEDKERFIFAVFLIDENAEGGETEEGYVKANPNYRLQLSLEEAKQIKFWDFYYNPTKPERAEFGTGLHRYLNDTQAAQVLKKIYEIRQGTLLESRAKQFFEYFCSIKGINVKLLPAPTGALLRPADVESK